MSKNIIYSNICRENILKGADQVANAVRITVGPRGRNCLLMEEKSGRVIVTSDGATIAKAIQLKQVQENVGAKLMKETAARVDELVGDGTATAVILAQAMLQEACKNIAAGANPIELRKGMQMAVQMATACIKKMSVPIRSFQELRVVAATSASDEKMGDLVVEAMEQAGPEGVITIEESHDLESSVSFQEGIVFERGFLTPGMTTDDEQKMAELHNPYILITDQKLDNPKELVPVLEMAKEAQKPLLVIADGIDPTVMGLFMRNKEALHLDIVGILPPLYGEGRKWRLEDLAVQTGGTFITEDLGLSLADVTSKMLGTAKYVKVERSKTTILGAGGEPEQIAMQEKKLRRMIEITDYEFNKKRYQERLAKFVSGVAEIRVGGMTEAEVKEKKTRMEDAYRSAVSAKKEGIVPGGGITLIDIMPPIKAYQDSLEEDKRIGVSIVLRVLEKPFLQIMENAGLDGQYILSRIREEKRGFGYDVQKESYTDMFEAGIVDSAKVVSTELIAAASVVGTVLTTEAELTESCKLS